METMSDNLSDNPSRPYREERLASNIVLMGGMSSGKSAVGWLLARLLGYGYFDLDALVVRRAGKPIASIFEEQGEAYFRDLEHQALVELAPARSHVIALGGGAVVRDDNWDIIAGLGTLVWLNPPPEEIARRLAVHGPARGGKTEAALRSRPLLADLADVPDLELRQKQLLERIKALVGQRADRYKKAHIVISDTFSTPESTAALIRDELIKYGSFKPGHEHRPFDRWHIL